MLSRAAYAARHALAAYGLQSARLWNKAQEPSWQLKVGQGLYEALPQLVVLHEGTLALDARKSTQPPRHPAQLSKSAGSLSSVI